MGDITIRIMFFSATSRLIFHAYCGGGCGGIFFVASIFTFFHTALEDGGGEEIKGPFTCIHLHTGMEWHEIYPPTCSKKV